jgi:HD-GYP domain-containing protein (c-di-GMP phosphodiesterase class II)
MSSVAYRSKDLVSFNRFLLCEGIIFDFDVFSTDTSNPYIRNIQKGRPVSVEVERHALTNSSLKLFIRPDDAEAYRSLLESIANDTLEFRTSVPGLFRDAACMQWIRDSFTAALDTRDTPSIFDSAMVNAERMIQWFSAKTKLRNVLEVLETSSTWQNYAINNATDCAYFAHSLGAKGNSLLELTRGALLAEIGYLDVDANALQAFYSPSIEEQRKLDAHPLLGLRRLATVERASWIQMMLVYQHHECLDTRGFPVGIPGDQISDAAKMYAVIDRFMSCGGNKHPYTIQVIQDAMSKLENEIGTRISKEHFQCWKSIVRSAL